jgi:hypothetical protein
MVSTPNKNANLTGSITRKKRIVVMPQLTLSFVNIG